MSDTLTVEEVTYRATWERLGEAVRAHAPGVVEALLFGSVARREDRAGSDVDILLVWPNGTDDDTLLVGSFETGRAIGEIIGRPCIPLNFTEGDYRNIPQRSPGFAAALERDGIRLLGE